MNPHLGQSKVMSAESLMSLSPYWGSYAACAMKVKEVCFLYKTIFGEGGGEMWRFLCGDFPVARKKLSLFLVDGKNSIFYQIFLKSTFNFEFMSIFWRFCSSEKKNL